MTPISRKAASWILALVCVVATGSARGAGRPNDPASLEFFETKVRPVLVEQCFKCHGSDKQKGGLRLDSRASILEGGETGPAAIVGKPEESLIVEAIRYGDSVQMPPKSRLPKESVEAIERWIGMGLPWPDLPNEPTTKTKTAQGNFDLEARKAEHWSWRSITHYDPPPAKPSDGLNDPVDAFILAGLEAKGLTQAQTADKRTLIRRAFFDLTGLPPTPEAVDAFLKDDDPKAYASLIDRLLASPSFGERWGRHWLDLVRYGETRGHEFDPAIPNAYRYRDYVIRALNADVPYNKFVTEHIAGDLLSEPRRDPQTGANESIVGTGFWFLGEEVHSPVDLRQDEADRFDNRIDVLSKTFLGLTVACARCHDHKFDAISQRDYYALSGFLASSGYRQARFATDRVEKEIAESFDALGTETTKRLAPMLAEAVAPALERLVPTLLQTKPPLLDPTAKVDDSLRDWVDELRTALKEPDHPLHFFAVCASDPTISADDARAFQGWMRSQFEAKSAATATLSEPDRKTLGVIIADFRRPSRIDRRQDGFSFGLKTRQPGEILVEPTAKGEWSLSIQQVPAARQEPSWLKVSNHKTEPHEHGRLGNWDRSGKTIRTPEFRNNSGRLWYLVNAPGHAYAVADSHLMINGPLHQALLTDWKADKPGWRWVAHNLADYKGFRMHVELNSDGANPLSVAMIVDSETEPPAIFDQPNRKLNQALANPSVDSLESLALAYRDLFQQSLNQLGSTSTTVDSDTARIADWIVRSPKLFLNRDTPQRQALRAEADRIAQERALIASRIPNEAPTALAMFDGSGFDESLLIRGSAKNPGPVVPRRLLEAISGNAPIVDPNGGSGRLQLAEAMVSPSNPYISRVIVNRIWHHLLGRGIVASTDNFGVLGERPTHPELLDHLAERFMADGWSIKRLIKAVMLSKTYRMSSRPDPNADLVDPNNLLWHRRTVKRLQAEPIRDAILFLSGRLQPAMYGPSVPVHLTSFMDGRGRPVSSGPLDGDGRRSLYLEIRRNFLSPMMLAFDAPIPAGTIGRRSVSNVPAQALILLNDPFVVEQAGHWADRALKSGERSPEQRIQSLYVTAFARNASPIEIENAVRFLREQGEEYKIDQEGWKTDRRPWSDLCHVLINSKEFVFID